MKILLILLTIGSIPVYHATVQVEAQVEAATKQAQTKKLLAQYKTNGNAFVVNINEL
jgi:hypothetical protein